MARELGVSAATLYAWKSKYGGMQVSDAKKLRQLEDENRRPKHMVADLSLDKEVDESGHRKKRMELVGARQDVAFVREKFEVSERRACELNHIDRSSYRYQLRTGPQRGSAREADGAGSEKPRWGYRRLGCSAGAQGRDRQPEAAVSGVPTGRAGRAPARTQTAGPRNAATMPLFVRPNQEWSMDFVSDALANGRALRALTVVDNFTKEAPAIEVDCSLSAPRVTRVLDEIIEGRGTAPESIRIDNGPEFTSRCFLTWAEQRGIRLVHIQPGKPTQNSFVESFNGRFRDECLNANWFENLADAKRKIEAWRRGVQRSPPAQQFGLPHAGRNSRVSGPLHPQPPS